MNEQTTMFDDNPEYQAFVDKFKPKKTTDDCTFISALDSQRAKGKAVFGGGLLLSDKAAAERAAAETWKLSPRELEIIKGLGAK